MPFNLTAPEKSKQHKTSGVCLLSITPDRTDLPDTKTPHLISPAYTPDSVWRNRDHFFSGREAIEAFLHDKWSREHNYRLRKELFAFKDNKMCVVRGFSLMLLFFIADTPARWNSGTSIALAQRSLVSGTGRMGSSIGCLQRMGG
jgi:hypothetical protein